MDESILKEIGLTGAEVSVYMALLELGSSTAGKIVEKSGLQNSVVHRTFHSLCEKGIITYSLEGKIRTYQPIAPDRLLDFVESKKQQLKEILPELKKRQHSAKSKPLTTTYQGVRGVRELWRYLIEDEGVELCSYGAPGRAHELLGDAFWKGHHRTRQERKIFSRHIFHKSLEYRGWIIDRQYDVQIRYNPQGFEGDTETAIAGKKVAIIIYLDEPIGFLIEGESVADSYQQFFEQLWDVAKKS